jgi:hypothetical protein
MKRIHATVLTAALLGGVWAWGQQPPAPAENDSVMTLTKDGQPHRYKILKTFKHPSGGTAYEVKDDATGEIMTVVENATPEQVKAVTKTEVKPADGAKSAKAVKADPIMQPTEFSADTRLRKQLGPADTKSADTAQTQYTRPPTPAPKRWFSWFQKDAKPAAPPVGKKVVPAPPARPTVIEAAYHPDPVFRLIGRLHDDLLPSMREVAAGELVPACHTRPDAVAALVRAAQNDPAPTVRACCCRHLGELRVKTPECLAALQACAADAEPVVRGEASNALAELYQP